MSIENKSVENTDTQFKKSSSDLTVLSLFSGCGGMDLGFEGDFDTLSASINETMHPDWAVGSIKKDMWVHLSKTRFHNIFANDIRKDAQEAWTNYFFRKMFHSFTSNFVFCARAARKGILKNCDLH